MWRSQYNSAVPSQFSSIGFRVSTGEDLAALASQVADRAETIDAADGQYLKWAPPTGEQLWLQVKRTGDAMGMNPHFEGPSVMRALLEARITRQTHTPLDGTFLAWANPPADGSAGGDYPFAFDCPDAAVNDALALPAIVPLQIAAFAQQITVHDSEAAFRAYQVAQGRAREGATSTGTHFDSRSFVPSGLISPSGEPVTPPEAHALIAGHVIVASPRMNSVTGHPFWWALVDTLGGTFDVVVEPPLLAGPIHPGNIVSGWFWLSGRIRREAPSRAGWFRRLTGRG
jgi:hypothetical protein